MKPGLVMKSTCFRRNDAFSCFIATIMLVRLEMSLPPPVPGRRVFGVGRIADEGRIEVAELVDLRAAHEADVDIAALQQQQHVSAAEHHVGALGATLVVGGWRQLAGLDKRADHAAFEQDGERGQRRAAPGLPPAAARRCRRRQPGHPSAGARWRIAEISLAV